MLISSLERPNWSVVCRGSPVRSRGVEEKVVREKDHLQEERLNQEVQRRAQLKDSRQRRGQQ